VHINEYPHEEFIIEYKNDGEYFSEFDNSSVEFIAEEPVCQTGNEMPNEPTSSSLPSSTGLDLNQAQTKFLDVMNLIENALKARSAEPQDPFYKYLESVLSSVNESTRRDIQLKVLNFVNDEIKRTGHK